MRKRLNVILTQQVFFELQVPHDICRDGMEGPQTFQRKPTLRRMGRQGCLLQVPRLCTCSRPMTFSSRHGQTIPARQDHPGAFLEGPFACSSSLSGQVELMIVLQ